MKGLTIASEISWSSPTYYLLRATVCRLLPRVLQSTAGLFVFCTSRRKVNRMVLLTVVDLSHVSCRPSLPRSFFSRKTLKHFPISASCFTFLISLYNVDSVDQPWRWLTVMESFFCSSPPLLSRPSWLISILQQIDSNTACCLSQFDPFYFSILWRLDADPLALAMMLH